MNLSEQTQHASPEDFYASLKEKLEVNHDFPGDYLYKFIVPSKEDKITEIYRCFDGLKYTVTNRDSKNGNYTSLTVNTFVMDADQVISIYKNVAKVDGVIML